MREIILLKQGEVILKGLNRRSFEMRLEGGVRRSLAPFGEFEVRSSQSVIYAVPQGDCDMDGAFAAAQNVFGIVTLSRAMPCEKNIDAIFATARDYLAREMAAARTFKVETKRADKRFPMSSIAVSQDVGGRLSDEFPDVGVDVHKPELVVTVEIREDFAFIHGNPVRGAGGLPAGSAGRVVSLLSGGIDSPVATYLAARRGAEIVPVHFFSYPYTSEQAKEKVLQLAQILTKYCGRMSVRIVPFTRIQEQIAEHCPEEYGTIITRRFMMAISSIIAEKSGSAAVVTGENLGQVASQTLESIAVTEDASTVPVLRPLITFDKREITEIAVKIGTFETSILPFEDCCTVFTPRRPSTKPRLDKIRAAEQKLDWDGLIAEAVAGIERINYE